MSRIDFKAHPPRPSVRWSELPSGEWGIRGIGPVPAAGATVEVTTRDGRKSLQQIIEIVDSGVNDYGETWWLASRREAVNQEQQERANRKQEQDRARREEQHKRAREAWERWQQSGDSSRSRRPFTQPGQTILPQWCVTLKLAAIPASVDAVQAAFRVAAKTAHPDAGGTFEAFVIVDRAYREGLAHFARSRRA